MTLALVAIAIGQRPQPVAEVPFRMGEEAIIVDAVVNGKTASFMFDTGFSGSVTLNEAINIGKATGSMTLVDFVGSFQAKTVPIKSLRLGTLNIEPRGMEAVQQPLANMTESYNTHTDGSLGLEVIKDRIFEISFQKNKFIFYPQSFDINTLKPDNQKTFLLKMLPLGNTSIELEVKAPGGKKMILALDTGNAFYATTHKDVLERVGLWEPGREPKYMSTSWVASGPVASWYKRLDDMTIFGVPVKTSFWDIIDLPASSADGDGTVGIGFLKNFNIIVDYQRRRVWLENFTGKVANEPTGEVGISAAHDPRIKRVRVYRLSPDGPAEKAGVKVNDQILAIDGQDLAAPTIRQIEKMLEGPEGSSVKLVISRNGNLMRLDVKRAILVNP